MCLAGRSKSPFDGSRIPVAVYSPRSRYTMMADVPCIRPRVMKPKSEQAKRTERRFFSQHRLSSGIFPSIVRPVDTPPRVYHRRRHILPHKISGEAYNRYQSTIRSLLQGQPSSHKHRPQRRRLQASHPRHSSLQCCKAETRTL